MRQPRQNIVWLASYPKSGNTWFRLFLSALMNKGEAEINNMKTDGIFSSRELFDMAADIDSRDLYDEEAKSMMADVYRGIASLRTEASIIKVHDAYRPELIPDDATRGAIYFIRNPLDIAGSLAGHMAIDIQGAVDMLCNIDGRLASQRGNLNKNSQFRQYLLDWSGHVASWTTKPSFPVHVVRYEDMLDDTFAVFKSLLAFTGHSYSEDDIEMAIKATSFAQLRRQESEKGFKEKHQRNASFFRSGTKGNWERELSPQQVAQIVNLHGEMMGRYY